MNTLKRSGPYLLLLLPLIFFAFFLHLDSLPFRVWDESLLATQTFQMMQDHDYIVVHNPGGPEMWNTKPPLAIWCMVAASRLIGFGELALRLPNAIAGTLICLVVFWFFAKRSPTPLTGLAAVMTMISAHGMMRIHGFRTGDYDPLLAMFVFYFCLCYYLILEGGWSGSRRRFLWICFSVFTICAIWTKGIASMIIVPGLLIYTLVEKKLIAVLRSKEFYLSAVCILFFGLGYYFLREHYNPGYIRAVCENELGKRFTQANEGHKGPFLYYINDIVSTETIWVPFFVIGVLSSFLPGSMAIRRVALFCTIVMFSFLLILSISVTKTFWYEAPALPLFAMLAGIGAYRVIDYLFQLVRIDSEIVNKLGGAILVCLIALPGYLSVIKFDLNVEEIDWEKDSFMPSHYVKERSHVINMDGYKIVFDDEYMHMALWCEVKALSFRGQKMSFTYRGLVQQGDIVLTAYDKDRKVIDGHFTHEVIDVYNNVEVWRLIERK